MPSYQFADLAAGRVTSGGTTAPTSGSSESWTVAAVTGTFPTLTAGQVFDVVDPAVPSELMTVTATASSTAWTVTRGAYGTTPLAHLSGFQVRNVVTAAGINAIGNGTFATLSRVDTAYGVATRGYPRSTRPVEKQVGYFGASGHGWSITGTGSSINDTTQPMLGTQSIKLVVAPSGGSQTDKSALTPFTVVNRNIRLTTRISGNITGILVYLASDNALANRKNKNFIIATGSIPQDTDVTIDIPYGEFGSPTGTIDPAAITMVRILAQAGPSGGTCWVGGIATTKDAAAVLPNGAVIFSADDTNIDHWNYLRPKLATYGFAATLYPNIAALLAPTGSNYTLAQAQYMQDVHGFDYGAHCIDLAHHIDHIGQTEAWLRDHAEQIIATNKQYGLRGTSFAWPNTVSDALARRVMGDYFRSARGGVGLSETSPPREPMNLRAYNAGGYTLAQLEAAVDTAKAGHSVAHFFFHGLPTTKSGANDTARQDFYDLVDYVAGQGVPVITASQFMELPVA